MAHLFDRTGTDPYATAGESVAEHLTLTDAGYEADADSQVYDALANAVVTAIGDIGAQALRMGVDEPSQLKGLADAIEDVAEAVLLAYRGEGSPEPALQALESDPRLEQLVPEQQDRLRREIEKTRAIETHLLAARRLPDLLDLAGQTGLYVPDEVMEGGEVMLARHPAPTAGESPAATG